ncbi:MULTISPECIES: DUF1127 domain-containing protein [Sediminimonas]|uniref:DUF1127 domain-containing protein n=1 Tax=Sediminimonas qiaohouensis TaxID=552061 RepID=A0A7C9LP27_9RHOB|nr:MULTISPECIES: DUF1127 domain-containing protein [Sediminimonas]MDR9485359.1 DUF1127 domain-containing protein [Sediminimonas sp.]MTJ04820.1 DUF1127 domain-containing protein [Sediminimonas qiaohouensis]
MAVFEAPRAHHLGLIGRIGQAFASVNGMLVGWHESRETRNALSKLSDRELEDIGLCRGDIDIVARIR